MDIRTTMKLNNGVDIPQLGLGVFLSEEGEETYNAVRWALDAGYRHIDTAKVYGNEASVGRAVKDSGIPREEIFITTKLWNSDIRDGVQEKAFYDSLDRLGCDYIDLYLIHWPVREGYNEAWKTMESLYEKKLIRAIGISNFNPHHYETLMKDATVNPAVNQIELHPFLTQKDVVSYFKNKNVAGESWSPLGRGELLGEPEIVKMAARLGKTPAQIIIRWHLQSGLIVIPKSAHKSRIIENASVFDFSLTEEQMANIDALNKDQRTGASPDNFSF